MTVIELQREAAFLSSVAREDVRTGQVAWARINQHLAAERYAVARDAVMRSNYARWTPDAVQAGYRRV